MKNNYQIGRLLHDIRVAKGITQSQVAYGIYGKASYSRIESGQQEPDKLLLDVLFERLGMSANQFGTSYTINEYLAIEWRYALLEAVSMHQWEETEDLLADFEEWLQGEGKQVGSEAFHRQFCAYIRLAMQIERETKENLEEQILTAIRYTVKDFAPEHFDHFLYGAQEMALLNLLAEGWFDAGKQEESVQFLYALLEYVELRIEDDMAACRFYPEMVLSLASKLQKMGRLAELDVCEKGIQMLQRAHRMNGLEGLLHLRLIGMADKESETEEERRQRILYRKGERILKVLREYFGIKNRKKVYSLLKVGTRGYVIGEQILRIRTSLGLTQKVLGEGICAEETLSRIERGVSRTKVLSYRKVMERLGVDSYRFQPAIETTDYQMHLILGAYVAHIEMAEYEEAEKKLQVLERNLDRESPINRQMLLKNRAIMGEVHGRITPEEEEDLLWEALYMTVPRRADLSMWPLNQEEVMILNNIAISLVNQNKRAEAVKLLAQVKGCLEFSAQELIRYRNETEENGTGLMYHLTSYLLITENLINFTGSEGRYEEALQIAADLIRYSYLGDAIYTLRSMIYEYAWNTEQILEQKCRDIREIAGVCMPLYYWSYLLAELTGQSMRTELIKERCTRKYGRLWSDFFEKAEELENVQVNNINRKNGNPK